MVFNNRELAFLTIILLFLLYVALKLDMKDSFLQLIKAFFQKKIILVLMSSIVWVIVTVSLLAILDLWRFDNFKTTVFWFITFVFVMISSVVNSSCYFGLRKKLKDIVNVSALIIFITNAHTFSYLTELFLVFITILLSSMYWVAVQRNQMEHRVVRDIVLLLLICLLVLNLTNSLLKILNSPDGFFVDYQFRELISPILLSISFLPFLFLIKAYVIYDGIYVGLHYRIPNLKMRRYALGKLIFMCKFNFYLAESWRSDLNYDQLVSKKDIDDTFVDLKSKNEFSAHL
ncbi:hypothetical protein AB8Q18_05730 [Neisseriaceae bacterium CLB008]